MEDYVLLLLCSFFAALIATMAGFGASTVLIPVAVYFMGAKLAIYFVAIFHLVTNCFKIRLFFKSIDKRILIFFGIPSIIFAFLGAYLSTVIPEGVVNNVLAVFLAVFAVLTFIKPDLSIAASTVNTVFGGSLSGFFAGLVGLGGALRGAFLVALNLPKDIYIATSSLIAFVVDLARIPVYSVGNAGAVDARYYGLLPFLVLTAYWGTNLGAKYINRVNQKSFKRFIAALLFLMAIKLILTNV